VEGELRRFPIYKTHLVKCKAPNNRRPTAQEALNCLGNFITEVRTLNPAHIVALGDEAAQALTGFPIPLYRGHIAPCIIPGLKDRKVLCAYDPEDLQKQRDLFTVMYAYFEKMLHPPKEYFEEYVPDAKLSDIKLWIAEAWKHPEIPVSADIETAADKGDALNPWKDKMIGMAFCQFPGKAIAIQFKEADVETPMKKKLVNDFLSSGMKFVYHNNTFDRLFHWVQDQVMPDMDWDTFDGQYITFSDSKRDLELLRSIHTVKKPYKHEYQIKGQVSHLSPDKLGVYACKDVDVTKQCELAQKGYFLPQQKKLMEHLLKEDRTAIKMRTRGVLISRDQMALQYLRLKPIMDELEEKIWSEYRVNINSPLQISDLLFKKKKMTVPRVAKRGKHGWSSDIKVLEALRKSTFITEERDMLDLFIAYRTRATQYRTYVEGVYKRTHDDGRLHPLWKPTGTDTGRWSCLAPNLMNVPEDMRTPYVPEEGKKFYIGDYKQLELVVGAILAGQYEFYEAVLRGEDVHEQVRQEMEKIAPATRMQAKAVGFGTVYGLEPSTLSKEYNIPLDIAGKWQGIILGRFPKFLEFQEKNLALWDKQGYLETPFGRRKYCETINEVRNFPIQSTAADIAISSLIMLEDAGWDPVLYIHDESVCEVDPNERSLKDFNTLMEHPADWFAGRFVVEAISSDGWEKP
jgi:DNA polymerase-1